MAKKRKLANIMPVHEAEPEPEPAPEPESEPFEEEEEESEPSEEEVDEEEEPEEEDPEEEEEQQQEEEEEEEEEDDDDDDEEEEEEEGEEAEEEKRPPSAAANGSGSIPESAVRELLLPFHKDQLISLLASAALSNSSVLRSIEAAAATDPNHRNLFVRGLGFDTTYGSLRSFFGKYGELEDVDIVTDKHTHRPKGFAFVLFKTRAATQMALNEPNKKIGDTVVSYNLASLGPPKLGSAALAVPSSAQVAMANNTQRKIYVRNVGPEVDPKKKFGKVQMLRNNHLAPLTPYQAAADPVVPPAVLAAGVGYSQPAAAGAPPAQPAVNAGLNPALEQAVGQVLTALGLTNLLGGLGGSVANQGVQAPVANAAVPHVQGGYGDGTQVQGVYGAGTAVADGYGAGTGVCSGYGAGTAEYGRYTVGTADGYGTRPAEYDGYGAGRGVQGGHGTGRGVQGGHGAGRMEYSEHGTGKAVQSGYGSHKGGTDCYRCHNKGHVAKDCQVPEGGCFTCGRLGHRSRECQGGIANQDPPRQHQQQNHRKTPRAPRATLNQRSGAKGRVFASTKEDDFT